MEFQSAHYGRNWLGWDKPTRLLFISATLRGYSDGLGAGCGSAKILVQSISGVPGQTAEQMRFRCVTSSELSTRKFEEYESVITEYYSHCTECRYLEVQPVLELLASERQELPTSKDLRKRIRVMSDR